MLSHLSTVALALVPGAPKAPCNSQLRQLRPALHGQKLPPVAPAVSAALTAPLLTAAPAHADDLVGTVVNLGLSAVVLGLLAFIVRYALEAAAVVGDQAGKVGQALEQDEDISTGRQPRPSRNEAVFDDSGTGAVTGAVPKRKGKGKIQKMESASGVAYAPWMRINQDDVEAGKRAREARKKAGK